MGRFWRGLLGLLGGILLLPLLLLAQPLTPDPAPVIRFDQGQLSVLRDPTQRLSLDQVRAAFAQGQFQPLPGNLGAGYVPDAFWLRFSLDRPPTQAAHWWLEVMPPYLDHIQLFHIDPTGQIDQRQGGDRLPQSAKEEAYRGTLFKLDLSPGSHEFYLRLQTTSTMTAIVKLWLPSAFAAHLRNSYFSFGLYFSLILAVSIFNAVNWMVSRRSIFLLYVVYLLLNALQWLGINGFVAEFLFPAQPLLANLTLGLTLSLAACVAFLFFAVVFELRRYHRTVYAINRLGALMALVTAIGTPFGYYQTLVPGLLLIALLSIFAALWPMQRLWRIGEPWSRLLVCAYIMFSGLMIFNILGSLAILPFSETSLYAGMLSNLFHILLLHFAILLHYRRVEKHHAEALEKAALAERRTALEQAHREEQRQLLAIITHEIRTPIAVIDAAAESLRMLDEVALSTDDDRTRRYERIRTAVQRMNMVMEMALAQREHDRWPFESRRIDLAWLTHEVLDLLGADAMQRIRFEMPEQELIVEADPRLIRIALLNLLDNALKYSPTGSPVTIDLEAAEDAGQAGAQWVIEDQGSGIPPAMGMRIFEKYQRGEQPNLPSGLGLGLYLVSRIVERHGGRIQVENRPGGGGRFRFWLPDTVSHTF
jgi:signal transduction histidine kinase